MHILSPETDNCPSWISGRERMTVAWFSQAFLHEKKDLRLYWGSSKVMFNITKTYLYNFDPLKPHFYIVKLGFTGVYIIFLISDQNIDCRYSLEPPRWGGSNEYPQSMFWAEIWKNISVFYLKIFSFWRWNFLYIWIPYLPYIFGHH